MISIKEISKVSFNINYAWIFYCISLSIISYFTVSKNLNSSLYIILNVLYFLFVFLGFKKGYFSKIKFNFIYFALGVIPLLFTEPIFEDDHHRYVWEGKVVNSGFSPYHHSPNSESLKTVSYIHRSKIGFPDLTTVYPPLALLIFSVIDLISFGSQTNLALLMLLNSFFVFSILRRISFINYLGALFLIPLLSKEFIQSIHIDLIAFYLMFLAFEAKSFRNNSLLFIYFISGILVKFLPLISSVAFLVSLLKKKVSKINIFLYFLLLTSLLVSFFTILYKTDGMSGYLSFSKYWVWNPGFYSFLWRGLGQPHDVSRFFSLTFFAIYLIVIHTYFYKKYLKISDQPASLYQFQYSFIYLIFAGFAFFSPVYNAWYAVWFFIPAIVVNLRFGIFYGVLSFLSYIPYSSFEILPYTEFLSHIFFIFSIVEFFRREKRSPH